jgi:outer membrane protein
MKNCLLKNCLLRIFPAFACLLLLLSMKAAAEERWTLQKCIEFAIQNNPDLQAAEARIKAATYYNDFQTKLFLPRLDLITATGYLTGQPISPIAVVGRATEEGIVSRHADGGYFSATPILNIPILKEGVLFAKNAPAINISEKQILIDKSIYEAKKTKLIYAIGSTFFNALKNRGEIEAAEVHVKYVKYLHHLALSKYNEGLISKNDLLMFEVYLASGEKELATARNFSSLLMAELSLKMGLEPTKGVALSVEDYVVPHRQPLEKMIATALSSRSEIKSQELQIAIAREQQRQAES